MRRWSAVLAASLLAAPAHALTGQPPAAAPGLLTAADPEGLAAAIRDLGYRATLGTDAAGDPKIDSATDGVTYSIHFYGCQSGRNCKWLLFSAGFDLRNGSTLRAMNAWNAEKLVGVAFLDDDDDPFLNFFVTLDGGVTRENFADVVDWWGVAIRDFKAHIGFAP